MRFLFGVLNSRALAHAGGVNRLRAMPQQPGVIAAWADTGAVQVCSETRVPAHRKRGFTPRAGSEDTVS